MGRQAWRCLSVTKFNIEVLRVFTGEAAWDRDVRSLFPPVFVLSFLKEAKKDELYDAGVDEGSCVIKMTWPQVFQGTGVGVFISSDFSHR